MSRNKPYLAGKREYLEIQGDFDWVNDEYNPNDEAEYSEFQKPYGDDDDTDYPMWEWTWPDIDFPDIPPIIYPDPIESKCSIDEDCVWAGVVGTDEMDCGDCYTFTQAHIWYGCDIAPWWAAYGGWTFTPSMNSGNCTQVFTGPIMTTICCDDEADGSFYVQYNGPLDCKGGYETNVTCSECCDEEGTTLTGADTVDAGSTWTGTISPACEGFSCRVTSNSDCVLGCDVNAAGSQVTVAVPATACGTFTVTVQDFKLGCNASASKNVRINDNGTWRDCGSFGAGIFCSGPWCGGDNNVDSDNYHSFVVWCWGGGMCVSGTQILTCDDGWSKSINPVDYCCNGCQDCTSGWNAASAGVKVWECSGECGT